MFLSVALSNKAVGNRGVGADDELAGDGDSLIIQARWRDVRKGVIVEANGATSNYRVYNLQKVHSGAR